MPLSRAERAEMSSGAREIARLAIDHVRLNGGVNLNIPRETFEGWCATMRVVIPPDAFGSQTTLFIAPERLVVNRASQRPRVLAKALREIVQEHVRTRTVVY